MSLTPATRARLTAFAARLQRDGRLPSLVAGITRGPELDWWCARGEVDGTPPDDDVQYRIGSITKTITAIAILRLRDEGQLSLDDPIEQHVEGTPYAGRTIGHLLAHGAGLAAESPTTWWERAPGEPWSRFADHLSAVFHRFMVGRGKVTIRVNGKLKTGYPIGWLPSRPRPRSPR